MPDKFPTGKKFKIEPETEREFTSKTKGLIKTPKKLPPYRRGPNENIDKAAKDF